MSVTKVFIEPNEDVVFACHKIATAGSRKVILVIPAAANVVSSKVSMKLLSRMLARTDKLVAVVTEDELGLKYAAASALAAVGKISDVTTEVWEQANTFKQELIFKKDHKKMELIAERSAGDYKIIDEEVSSPIDEGEAGAGAAVVVEDIDAGADSGEKVRLVVDNPEIPNIEESIKPIMPVDTASAITAAGGGDMQTNNTSEEVKPLFNKLEPKLIDLEEYALLTGGDVAVSALGPMLRNKMRNISKLRQPAEPKKKVTPEPETLVQELDHRARLKQGVASFTHGIAGLASRLRKQAPPSAAVGVSSVDAGVVPVGGSIPAISVTPKLAVPEASIMPEVETVLSSDQDKAEQDTNITHEQQALPESHVAEDSAIFRTPTAKSRFTDTNFARAGAYDRLNYQSRGRSSVPQNLNNISPRSRSRVNSISHAVASQAGMVGKYWAGFRNASAKYWGQAGSNKPKVLAGVAALGLVFVLLSVFVFPSAEVVVNVASRDVPISQKVTALVDATAVDISALTVPMRVISRSASRSDTFPTTGTGQKGEKARGSVNMLNSSNVPVQLKAGRVLTAVGKSGIEYSLDSDVVIPASGNTNGVRITALDIGTQYNQETNAKKDFKLKDGGNPDLLIFSYSQITGGSKSDTKTVGQSDYDGSVTLLTGLTKDALESEIQGLLSSSEVKLYEEIKFGAAEVTSDKKVGDEADNFNLTVTMKAEIAVVSAADLASISEQLVREQSQIAAEVKISGMESPTLSEITVDGSRASFTITTNASVSAQFDKDELRGKVLGVGTEQAEQTLRAIPDVEQVKINYSPAYLPGFLRRMPSSQDKIEVELSQ